MGSITTMQLPTEIQVLILQNLSTNQLLQKCRTVSQQWNQIATSLCRKRYNSVSVNGEKFYDNLDPEYITQVFLYKENLPWSAVHIQLSCGYHGSAVNRKIAKSFGIYIKRLVISVETYNYDTLIYVLRKMPNIEVLSINATTNTDRAPVQQIEVFAGKNRLPPPGIVTLKKLKTFQFTVNDKLENILLEFILNKAWSSLTEVSIKIIGFLTRVHEFQNMLEVLTIADVAVSLNLTYMHLTLPCWRQLTRPMELNLCILTIQLKTLPHDVEFGVLEDSLAQCRRLVTLSLHFNCSTLYSSQRFTMPELPQLEVLELHSRCSGMGTQGHGSLPLNTINPAFLPKLRKVWILNNTIEKNPEDFKPIFRHSNGHQFVTVTEFIGNDANDMFAWIKIFPQLMILQLTNISRGIDLEHIFKCMPNLKYLSINLSAMQTDVNLVLAKCCRSLGFTGLRGLTVEDFFTGERKHFRWNLNDSGAISLLLLPPLHLRISCTSLSQGCISKLRSYHKIVEIF